MNNIKKIIIITGLPLICMVAKLPDQPSEETVYLKFYISKLTKEAT